MKYPSLRLAAILSLVATGSALAVALGSERFLGLVPCALCLVERWPYYAAVLISAVSLALPARFARISLWLVVLLMLCAVVLAGVHVGVEQGFWESPLPECAAPSLGSGSIAQRLAAMPERPSKPCDDPTYLVPGLPVSMAAMGGLCALSTGLLLAVCLFRRPVRRQG